MVSYQMKLIILSSSLVVFSLLVIGPLYIIKKIGENMSEEGEIHFLNIPGIGLSIVVGNISEEHRAYEFEPGPISNETGRPDFSNLTRLIDMSNDVREGMIEVERMLDQLYDNTDSDSMDQIENKKSIEIPNIFGLTDMDNSLLAFLKGLSNSADQKSRMTHQISQHEHSTEKSTSLKSTTRNLAIKSTTAKSELESSEPEIDLTFRSIFGLANISAQLNVNQDVRRRRDIDETELLSLGQPVIENKLIGRKVRISGSLLPFSATPLTELGKLELKNLVQHYKKSGPMTPAFIDDSADPIDGESAKNPLRV